MRLPASGGPAIIQLVGLLLSHAAGHGGSLSTFTNISGEWVSSIHNAWIFQNSVLRALVESDWIEPGF